MTHTASGRSTTAPAVVTALRVLSVLTVLALLWQFVTPAGSSATGGRGRGGSMRAARSSCTSCPG